MACEISEREALHTQTDHAEDERKKSKFILPTVDEFSAVLTSYLSFLTSAQVALRAFLKRASHFLIMTDMSIELCISEDTRW